MAGYATYHPGIGVIETTFGGELTPDELRGVVEEAMALARQHSTFLFLADCMGLAGGHNVFDLYGLVEFLQAQGLPPGFKEALLMPGAGGGLIEGVEFWETACLNRGINVRMFDDRAAALAWLME